jgi:tRNA(Arg) A34 adenosine deaminase TadA
MQEKLQKIPQKFRRSFQKCIVHAKSNPDPKFKFCCVAMNKQGHIIAMSYQKRIKSHPVQYYYAVKAKDQVLKINLHAEIATLIKASNPYAIFVVRLNSKGALVSSKPCLSCELAITSNKTLKFCWYSLIDEICCLEI